MGHFFSVPPTRSAILVWDGLLWSSYPRATWVEKKSSGRQMDHCWSRSAILVWDGLLWSSSSSRSCRFLEGTFFLCPQPSLIFRRGRLNPSLAANCRFLGGTFFLCPQPSLIFRRGQLKFSLAVFTEHGNPFIRAVVIFIQ